MQLPPRLLRLLRRLWLLRLMRLLWRLRLPPVI